MPAIAAAHGRTDDAVDFVFRVLAATFHDSRQDHARVWRGRGSRDAVVQREPRAFARHVADELAEVIRMGNDPGRYGAGGLDRGAQHIPRPHEPRVAAFLDELQRLVGDPGAAVA